MTGPSDQMVTVAIESLRTASGRWMDGSQELRAAETGARDLELTRLQAGIFQGAYDEYVAAATYIAERLDEGAQEFTRVGFTLGVAASVYQREEEQNLHELRGLY